MRLFLAILATIGALLAGSAYGATAANPVRKAPLSRTRSAQRSLRTALLRAVRAVGGTTGAYVLDLNTGQVLFSSDASAELMPASVEKLYTTSTALLRLGPNATLTTTVFGTGSVGSQGVWHGTLYLKGGGDPTFGSSDFDQSNYGTGATVEQLAAEVKALGISSISGRIIGDESYFDSLRGTPPTGGQFSAYVEGSLSALAFNRGLVNQGAGYVVRPALYAAQQLELALRADGVHVPANTPLRAGPTPAGATQLAAVNSPPLGTLLQLTNSPSDNFFAEMLLKGLGARFGGAGTTAAGAAVVRAQLASSFGIHPQLDDGSGLSTTDLTSPLQVVTLLKAMATNSTFVNSLAIAGETGTLQDEMNGTRAQGRCHGKTGTLHNVASLVGYCTARDGHTLAFAFLMNYVDPDYGHDTEANMAVSLANYRG